MSGLNIGKLRFNIKAYAIAVALCLGVFISLITPVYATGIPTTPGKYEITANMSTNIHVGFFTKTMFLTNPKNPLGIGGNSGLPTSKVENNAYLDIKPNGTKQLIVPLKNPIVCIQKLGGVDGAKLVKYETCDIEANPDNPSYIEAIHKAEFTTRISKVVIELEEARDNYTFKACDAYGTYKPPFGGAYGEFSEDVELSIDYASAKLVEGYGSEVVVPEASQDLIYTGSSQIGVKSGKGYELSGDVEALDAGAYVAHATLSNPHDKWSDGTSDPKEIHWSIKPAKLCAKVVDETIEIGQTPKLDIRVSGFVAGESADSAKGYKAPQATFNNINKAGVYSVVAAAGQAYNYEFDYIAGQITVKDTQKPDLPDDKAAPGVYKGSVNLYIPGSQNPIMPGLQPYFTNPSNPEGVGGHQGIPTDPVTNNAEITINQDKTITIKVDAVNPVFTLQSISSGSDFKVVKTDLIQGDFGRRDSRIKSMVFETDVLKDTYTLGNSLQYVTLFDKEINATVKVDVDFDNLIKIGDVDIDQPTEPTEPTEPVEPTGPTDPVTPSNPDDKTDVDDSSKPATPEDNNQKDEDNARKTYKAGTYTVSANINIDKDVVGLPLSPYFTSPRFPPKDPVSQNAKLVVDENGRAKLIVPIRIQSRIMSVNSISGLGVVDVERQGSGISSITIDLGVIYKSSSKIYKSGYANVDIGKLAMSIGGDVFGGVVNHTYPISLVVDIKGVPTSANANVSSEEVEAMFDVADKENDEASEVDSATKAALESSKAAYCDKPQETNNTAKTAVLITSVCLLAGWFVYYFKFKK